MIEAVNRTMVGLAKARRLAAAVLCGLMVMGVSGQALAAEDSDSVQARIAELQNIVRNSSGRGMAGGDKVGIASQSADRLTASSRSSSNRSPSGASSSPLRAAAKQQDEVGKDQAFTDAVQQLIPLSPEQINKLREVYAESQAASALSPGAEARPTSSALAVDLAPNATPPVIRLGAGYITSILFLDSSGQPWPIAAYSLGDPSAFNIQWDRKGNTLLVQSSTFYRQTNLAVMLKGLNTPVMITLMAGQGAIDYRVDLRVPGFGPNAVFMRNSVTDATDPLLLEILNGIPPAQAKELKIKGVVGNECRAWVLNNQLYVRTNMHVISPGWQAVIGSVDGMRAYRMQYTPVLLVTRNGSERPISLNLGASE